MSYQARTDSQKTEKDLIMKKYRFFPLLALLCVYGISFQETAAQFPIKLPKIKAERPKTEAPKPDSDRPAANGSTTASAPVSSTYSTPVRKPQYNNIMPSAEPLLVRDSVYIQAATHQEYWKTPGKPTSSWVPTVRFSVFYDWKVTLPFVAEYFNPDGSLWFDETVDGDRPAADATVQFKNSWQHTKAIHATKSTIATGLYGIKITNKASGQVVFQGKFKVGKFPAAWKGKTASEFYVDHDWLMPIRTVSFHFSNFNGGDLGTNFPVVVGMWFKKAIGSTDHGFEARLFYKDQQIAVTQRLQEKETRASDTGNLSGELHHWARWDFQWTFDSNVGNVNVDNGGSYHRDNMPKSFFVDKNPGEYTVKVFHKGVQVREAKFTVGADGRVADGGYQKPGYLTYHKVIIPVTIIGPAEKYNAAAWKTEAFYGNPLSGFSLQ